MMRLEARAAESQAWRAYKGYINEFITERRTSAWVFEGDDQSRALFSAWRAARSSLQAVTLRPRYKRHNIRFKLKVTDVNVVLRRASLP